MSISPARPGPYSARRAGKVASCATAVSTAQFGPQSATIASTSGKRTATISAPSERSAARPPSTARCVSTSTPSNA